MNIGKQPNQTVKCESSRSKEMTHLLALQTVLVDGESILQELLLLLQVNGLETSGHGGARGTTSVQDVAAVVVLGRVQHSLNTGLDERPGTGVERLLLAPDDVLSVGVAVQVLLQLVPGEGVQLLHTSDGGVADAIGLAVLDKGGVDLARAHDHTLNLLVRLDSISLVGRVRDDPLEVGVTSEGLQVRAGNGMTQKRLGEEDDKGWLKDEKVSI